MTPVRATGLSVALVILLAVPATSQSIKMSQSLPELQERARRDSLDPAAYYNLGVGYMAKKKFPEAEQAFQQALAIDPRFAEARLALAVAHERNDDFWRAQKTDSARRAASESVRQMYQRAFLIDPFVDVQLMALLFRIPSGWGDYLDALKAFVEGRYPEAYTGLGVVITEITKKQPLDSVPGSLLWIHALSAVQVKEYGAAEEDLGALLRIAEASSEEESIDFDPMDANEYRYMLAALKHRTGAVQEATALYQAVLEADVSNYMAHVQLARIYEEQKKWPQAVSERRRAMEVEPDDASLRTDLGVTLGRSGDFSAAVEVLREASAANPRDVRPLFWLGIAEMQLGNREAARAAFTQFVAVAPSRQEAQVAVARQRLAALQ